MYECGMTENSRKVLYSSTKYSGHVYVKATFVLGCNNRGTEVIIPAGSRIILRHWKLKYIILFTEWLARNRQATTALIFKVEQHGGGICENMVSLLNLCHTRALTGEA